MGTSPLAIVALSATSPVAEKGRTSAAALSIEGTEETVAARASREIAAESRSESDVACAPVLEVESRPPERRMTCDPTDARAASSAACIERASGQRLDFSNSSARSITWASSTGVFGASVKTLGAGFVAAKTRSSFTDSAR